MATTPGLTQLSAEIEESADDKKRTVKGKIVYRYVYAEGTRNKGPVSVAEIVGVPQIGSVFTYTNVFGMLEVMPFVYCKNRRLKHSDKFPHTVDIEAMFDSSFDPDKTNINPLDRPTKYSFGFDQFQKAIEKDLEGEEILNSAGDAFTDTPQIDDSRPTIKVVRNEATFPLASAEAYQDATNSDPVYIHGNYFEARTLKMRNISGEPQEENDMEYYQVTYEIQVRRDGWRLKLLDKGHRSLDEPEDGSDLCGGELPGPIRDSRGVIVPIESLLDGDGGVLCPDDDPVYLEFNVFKQISFGALGL